MLPPGGGVRIPVAYEQSDPWCDEVSDDIEQLSTSAQEAHNAYQPLPSTFAAVTAALSGMPAALAAPLFACLRDTASCASFLEYIQGDCDFSVLHKRDKTRVTVGKRFSCDYACACACACACVCACACACACA